MTQVGLPDHAELTVRWPLRTPAGQGNVGGRVPVRSFRSNSNLGIGGCIGPVCLVHDRPSGWHHGPSRRQNNRLRGMS